MKNILKNAAWKMIEMYFDGQHLQRLVRHQIESYNHFIHHQIQNTIDMFNPVKIVGDYNETLNKHELEINIVFSNFHIFRPQIHENNGATKLMFPHEARLRNFTYSSTMTIDINIEIRHYYGDDLSKHEIFYKKLSKIHIGKMPVMLKSKIYIPLFYFLKHMRNVDLDN